MNLTARCTRYDGWWIVRVPEVEGLFTQVRRLDQVEAMVLDAASMLDDQPPEGFTVTVVPELDESDTALLSDSRREIEHAQQASLNAARTNRATVAQLRERGYTVRDIATLMGISQQRVSQLQAGTR